MDPESKELLNTFNFCIVTRGCAPPCPPLSQEGKNLSDY
jgi:hypothetical protein